MYDAKGFCPQCGAAVRLSVGDPLLKCSFCRTSLYMVPPGAVFRYFLNIIREPSEAHDPDLIWLPYWLFRGLRYKAGVSARPVGSILDISAPALSAMGSGPSLGITPQGAGIRLCVESDRLVAPDRNIREAVPLPGSGTNHTAAKLDKGHFYRLIGETRSLIYAPFRRVKTEEDQAKPTMLRAMWGRRRLIRVNLKSINSSILNDSSPLSGSGTPGALSHRYKVRFLPLICPECGSGLPDHSYAIALLCSHCGRLWSVRDRKFAGMKYSSLDIPATLDKNSAIYLPFWQLRLAFDGFPAESMASFYRLALPWKTPPAKWENISPTMLIPAFKLNPALFLRMAALMTRSPLVSTTGTGPLRGTTSAEPVRIAIQEAAQGLKVVMAEIFKNREKALALVPQTRLKVRGISLLFLPFEKTHRSLIQCHTGTAIDKRALQLGRNI